MRPILVAAAVLLNLAAASPAATGAEDPRALEILRRAQEAAEAAGAVSYRFEWLGVGSSRGRITGSARMRRVTDQTDSLLAAEGEILYPPPRFEEFPERFAVSTDGEISFLLDRESRTLHRATAEAGDGHLRRVHPYIFIYHLVNPGAFLALPEPAETVAYMGTGTVRGEECDIVFLDKPSMPGMAKSFWYFSRKDHLPRAWQSHGQNDGVLSSFDFRMWEVKTSVGFDAADVAMDPPSGFRVVDSDERVLEVGRPAPDFALSMPGGREVRLSDLRGETVVLDFWVSWCPACAYFMPGIQEIHQDFQGRPVKVLGVNMMETADPVAHMKKMGFTYPTLLDGEKIADLYKVNWQPAVFVIGPDGTLLYKDNGTDPKRNQSVRRAIASALAAAAR